MTQLVRLFYTSVANRRLPHNLQQILDKSVDRNAANGITGVLLFVEGKYIQVIEGTKSNVMALFTRLQSDPRHHSLKIHFEQNIETRMFEGWSLASPPMGNQQIRSTLELLTSQDTASQEIGLTYLKYWLTTQSANATAVQESGISDPIRVDDFISAHQRSRDFSIIAFCVAILVAVMVDISFYITEYLAGDQSSLRMIYSHAFTAVGLILSVYVANRIDLARGVAVFQIVAFVSVALHMLYAGYGISAPSIPYLGLAIVTGIISNKPDENFKLLFACLALIVTGVLVSSVGESSAYFSVPVPLHHIAVAGLLFPMVCALILDAQRHRTSASQRFGAQILSDLTKNIDRLKAAMAARNYFFSAISHEIRTPMAGAISSVTLLQHPNASEQIKARSLASLDQSLNNLNRLLNDLLDISKLESGHFQLASEPFDVVSVTREAVEFFTPGIEEKGNTLEVQLPENSPLVVGDSMRYRQMLSNLLSNAVKFTNNGRISVTLKQTNAGTLEASTAIMWKCEVADTGVGIPQADLAHLFQPFSQASQHGYSKTKGTGLGLAIVASLSKQMGGDAGVQSTEGTVSQFWFTFKLPIHQASQIGQDAAALNPPAKSER